ncbi:hypothetical protein KAW18_12000 [candidate division WOR-3 bacterium]|nr:hypothetical protein [candidate division WOR-3 bacterium]MCK4528084.1 hypothetical protein [candidate division WOR-3 bacterium]
MDLAKIPMYWGLIVSVIIFVGIAIWAVLNPREYIYEGAENRARWRDLRIWAAVLMGIQIAIHVIWGGR